MHRIVWLLNASITYELKIGEAVTFFNPLAPSFFFPISKAVLP